MTPSNPVPKAPSVDRPCARHRLGGGDPGKNRRSSTCALCRLAAWRNTPAGRRAARKIITVFAFFTIGLAGCFDYQSLSAGVGAFPSDDALTGYWRLDGDLADETGQTAAGTATGATVTAGKVGKALQLDGSSTACLAFPESSPLDMTGATAATAMAWVKSEVAAGRAAILGKAGEYGLYAANGALQEQLATAETPDWQPRGSAALATGEWHHAAVAWDGSMVTTYLDGVIVATRPLAGHLSPTTLGAASRFGIGCDNVPNSAYPWKGALDEVRVYARALSAAEVAGYVEATK